MVVVMGLLWSMVMGMMVFYTSAAISAGSEGGNQLDTGPAAVSDSEDQLLKQIVWKRCYRRISPACMKLSLVRTVEMLTKDSAVTILPGVSVFSNTSGSANLPPDLARDLAPLDDVAAYSVSRYLRSLTLNVNLADFVTGGNTSVQADAASGRKKAGGFGGYAAVAAMLGGTMATMMMAGLAAMAGKALMTSMLALMMSAFSAMRGGGGGGGGGETKTYEVITKPIVSHINTHSSEVQHEHHGHYHKRSLNTREDPQHSQEQGPSGREERDLEEPTFTLGNYNHYQKRSVSRDEPDGSSLGIINNPYPPQDSQTVGRGKRSVKFERLPDSKIYKYPNIPQSLKGIYSTLSAQIQHYNTHRRTPDGQLILPLKFTS